VIITAPGKTSDFVSRFFAPKLGISEDPVTGSAHCALAPYWGRRLDKKRLFARQLSKRKGALYCEVRENRVLLSGQAVLFMKGTITL
jgi:predicted PhzF superfamily epimerase YddE/YHI9